MAVAVAVAVGMAVLVRNQVDYRFPLNGLRVRSANGAEEGIVFYGP